MVPNQILKSKITLIKTENGSELNTYTFCDRELLDECVSDCKDKLLNDPPIFIFGKKCFQKRSIGFFSDESKGYFYSNQLCKSQKLSKSFKELLDKINTIFNLKFNGILVNFYRNGEKYIGKHSDDETNLTNEGVIAISVGAERKFRIRDKKTKKIVLDIPTKNYEIIQMKGNFQKEFTHEIPIQKKLKKADIHSLSENIYHKLSL